MDMSTLFGVSVGWLLGMETDMPKKEPVAPVPIAVEPPEPIVTGPEEEPERDASPLPHPVRHWFRPAMAGAVVLSLILSCAGLARNFGHQDTAEEEVFTVQADQSDRIEQLEEELEALRDQYTSMTDALLEEDLDLYALCYKLEDELERVKARLPEVTPPEDPSTPGAESLESWSLTGDIDPTLHTVTLTFNCTTVRATESAQLMAVRSEDLEDRVAVATCGSDGQGYTAQIQVPVADGYQYVLMLTYPDSSVERIVLNDHGLSDLIESASVRLVASPSQNASLGFHTDRKFWIGWEGIVLTAPRLVDKDSQFQWQGLRICYYHNSELVSEVPLEDHLSAEDLESVSLDFQLPTQTFTMPAFKEGDKLALMLEGTLSIDGERTDFSYPLIRWLVLDQQLMEYD